MKIKVKNLNVDWLLIKNLCRQTVNKNDSELEPTDEWKRKLLICRHSPLRSGTMLIQIEDVPYYVHTHLVRHNVGITPYVGTSREDRTGKSREERKQTDLISMQMLANIEALMNISEKRLCLQADKNTIKVWQAVLEEIKKYDENIYWACVPSCIRCGACIEKFSDCKFYENLMKNASKEELIDIKKRYNIYNEYREKTKKKIK